MTSPRVRFHRAAREEAEAAVRWYDERLPGLGADFIAEVGSAVARIAEAPASWPVCPSIRARDGYTCRAFRIASCTWFIRHQRLGRRFGHTGPDRQMFGSSLLGVDGSG